MTGVSHRGRLLVAAPMLLDPNFERTVVFLVEHTEEGAFGLVLNRPTDQPFPWPLAAWEELVAEPGVVFSGGPVQPEVGVALGAGASIESVDLDSDPETLAASGVRVRVFAGYAGWGPQQLEGELEEGAWFVVDADVADVVTANPEELWWTVLARQPPPLNRVALFPPLLAAN